jgi:nucleotide-binding universal stress UspA family protein
MMVKKILVATDGSEPAERALNYALDLAESTSAEVVIVSVVPPVLVPIIHEDPRVTPLITSRDLERIDSRMRTIYENSLSEALAKARSRKPGLKVSTMLAEGRPADTIAGIAEREGFDLIVMGSRGLHGISEFLLGSTTHRVADISKIPLLIVK